MWRAWPGWFGAAVEKLAPGQAQVEAGLSETAAAATQDECPRAEQEGQGEPGQDGDQGHGRPGCGRDVNGRAGEGRAGDR